MRKTMNPTDAKKKKPILLVPKGKQVQGVQTAEIAGRDQHSKSMASLMYPKMTGPGAK